MNGVGGGWNVAADFVAAIAVVLSEQGRCVESRSLTNVASITLEGAYMMAEMYEAELGLA